MTVQSIIKIIIVHKNNKKSKLLNIIDVAILNHREFKEKNKTIYSIPSNTINQYFFIFIIDMKKHYCLFLSSIPI